MERPIPADVNQQIADHLYAGRKIAAIKLYREHSGQGLKEAKDWVEALEAELRAKEPGRFTAPPRGKGCLGVIALCAGGALVVVSVLVTILR